jgi:dTDP-4-amino-4,6-dideoxygalactose transaminase
MTRGKYQHNDEKQMTKKPIPYGRQNITQEDINAVVEVLKSDYLTQGPKIADFEQAFAEYVGSKYAVAVANGTAALHLCTLAMNVQPGEKVITTPITFAASANCVRYAGGDVIFADIDPETYLLDINKVEEILKKEKNIKGIIPVDFAGRTVNLEAFRKLADKHNLWIIEDACHAPGGYFIDSYGQKQLCGNGRFADLAIFSFHPVKHIAAGEGGMITTNDEELYKKLLTLRTHGITKDASLFQNTPETALGTQQITNDGQRPNDPMTAKGSMTNDGRSPNAPMTNDGRSPNAPMTTNDGRRPNVAKQMTGESSNDGRSPNAPMTKNDARRRSANDAKQMTNDFPSWYYEMQSLGFNYRLTDFQAALGNSQLKRANEGLERRREIAKTYYEAFNGKSFIKGQSGVVDGHAYHLYVIEAENRKGLYEHLRANNIFAQIHYVPIHLMPYYKQFGWKEGNMPNAEQYYSRCISLPMFPTLTNEEQKFVINCINNFYNN